MTARPDPLPSWRAGAARDALVAFLAAAESVPRADRLACFDNDGTLWCERPSYVQLDFFVDALRRRAAADPTLRDRPELAAVLDEDRERIGALGLARVALALAGLFEGLSSDAFAAEVREFLASATHPELGIPFRSTTYRPMLELLDELRRLDFTIAVATGGGTEFVRAVSTDLYGVPPERVVGTLVAYELGRDARGRPEPHRTARILGDANEGAAKVTNIQTQLGRRPILAAGNSSGDREMLEWACSGDGPCLALLVDHDDAQREYAYASKGETVTETEPILDVAARSGWTVASIARDWTSVFTGSSPGG